MKISKQSLFVLGSLTSIVVVSIVIVLLILTDRPEEREPLLELVEPVKSSQPDGFLIANQIASSSEKAVIDFESVQNECIDIRIETSHECIEALDEFFMDSPIPSMRNDVERLFQLHGEITFRRVFANPSADRKFVLESLSNSECRLEEGEIRFELASLCHADAIANYAVFTKQCKPTTLSFRNAWFNPDFGCFGIGIANFDLEMSEIERHRDLDRDEYEESRRFLEENVLRHAWLEHKCSQFKPDVMQPLGAWPSISQKIEEKEAQSRLDSVRDREITILRRTRDAEYPLLIAVAARVGDEWALTEHFRSGRADSTFVESVETYRPWIPYLHRASTFTGLPRAELLSNAISAVISAENHGHQIDYRLLTKIVCRQNFLNVSCATAFEQLEHVDLSWRARRISDDLKTELLGLNQSR